MNYNVKSGERNAKIDLDGTECKIVFDCFNVITFPFYRAFAVQNDSSEDVVLSIEQGKTENDDGVVTIHPGMSAVLTHMNNTNTCFVTGTGSVQVAALNTLTNPFKSAPAGGQGGGVENPELVAYALKDSGYAVTDDPKTWDDAVMAKFKAYDYRLDYTGTIFVYGGRTVTRDTDKLAYCGYSHTTGGWWKPIVIAADPEATVYTMWGATTPLPPSPPYSSSFIGDDGETVYCNFSGTNSLGGWLEDTSGYNRRCLGVHDDTVEQQVEMGKKLYHEIKMLGYSLYE